MFYGKHAIRFSSYSECNKEQLDLKDNYCFLFKGFKKSIKKYSNIKKGRKLKTAAKLLTAVFKKGSSIVL